MACDGGFIDGEPVMHLHRNQMVVMLFHVDCWMPFWMDRFESPVGLPLPCECDLSGEVPATEYFGAV
jgi:hypothetical protein